MNAIDRNYSLIFAFPAQINMVNKSLLLITMVFFLTLLLSVVQSRRRLWQANASRNSRIFTFRAIVILVVIVLFLFFTLVR
jgi:hypothetical protein